MQGGIRRRDMYHDLDLDLGARTVFAVYEGRKGGVVHIHYM